jgi:hypothetical protein
VPLNHRAVGYRVAERDTQLDHVGARFGKREHKLLGRGERRVARGEIRDEAHFSGAAQGGKALRDAQWISHRCSRMCHGNVSSTDFSLWISN